MDETVRGVRLLPAARNTVVLMASAAGRMSPKKTQVIPGLLRRGACYTIDQRMVSQPGSPPAPAPAIEHPAALIGGAVLFVVGLIPAVPRIFLESSAYSNGEAFVIAAMLMAGGCLLIRFGGARRLGGGLAIVLGAAAVLKPAIAPISYG